MSAALIVKELESVGLQLTDTGGGCGCMERDLGGGFSIVVTDGEAGLPQDSGPVWVGLMHGGNVIAGDNWGESAPFLKYVAANISKP